MAETVPVNVTFHKVHHSEHYKKWLNSKSERYHEYRRKWAENPVNFIDEGHPLHLDIEASSACNLRCPMCARTVVVKNSDNTREYSKHFDFSLYQRLLDEAAKLGVYSITLNWFGEPLTNPRIIDMIRYAKSKGIEDVIMVTNATLLTEKMSRELISSGIDKICFSFDSPYKDTYEKIRIGASYDHVLANIRRFHEIRTEMDSMTPIMRASMVLWLEDKGALEAYTALFRDIVDIVAYYDFVDYEKDYSFLKERKDIKFSCSQLWHRLVINTEGEISICCKDHFSSCGIGNIKNTTIYDAWNGSKLKALRELHKNKQWYNVEICSCCPMVLFEASGSV